MRIAVPDFVSSTFFPLVAAKALSIFEEEGQDVEIVHSNALKAVESLRDGAVDFSAGPAHAPMMFFPEWRGVKLVAAISQGTPWMLVMKSGLAKRGEIAAVKGRRIAANGGPDLIFKHIRFARPASISTGTKWKLASFRRLPSLVFHSVSPPRGRLRRDE